MRWLNLLLALAFIGLQAKLWLGQGGLPEVWELEQSKRAQREENARLSERNASLEAEVLDLKEGLEAVEERARAEMGMVKEGEIFYQILNAQALQGSPEGR